MPRVLLVLVVLAASIFCIIECIQSDDREIRNLPKIVWLLVILIAPIVGSVAWLLAGRPQAQPEVPRAYRPPVARSSSAPDDDPMFLAGLERTNEERRRLQAWERELEARERELRGSAGSDDVVQPGDKHEDGGPGDEPANRS